MGSDLAKLNHLHRSVLSSATVKANIMLSGNYHFIQYNNKMFLITFLGKKWVMRLLHPYSAAVPHSLTTVTTTGSA
jgi:hypothetical protein